MTRPIRVLFSCTGVGLFNRGIESFFREAFDGLKSGDEFECRLLKGAGAEGRGQGAESGEWVVKCLPRSGKVAALIGRLTGRSAYAVEQWSSFPGAVRRIRQFRPQVIFYSDSNLGFLLYWRRKQIGVRYRLLFSNGGPCHPPFDRTDFVQQLAPFYQEEALRAGEPADKHFLVPYGINVTGAPVADPAAKETLRISLHLPLNRPVVLSVGWISRTHKRMHYIVEEVARLPQPRPFLQLLGAMDDSSREIVELAERLLGRDGFSARSVSYSEVFEYYRASDVFALASLQEGFGRVYLEALMHGLPVIAHRHPVVEYVLGNEGVFGDLNRAGELADLLSQVLQRPPDAGAAERRWRSVRDRFSWPVLAPAYREMFRATATRTLART